RPSLPGGTWPRDGQRCRGSIRAGWRPAREGRPPGREGRIPTPGLAGRSVGDSRDRVVDPGAQKRIPRPGHQVHVRGEGARGVARPGGGATRALLARREEQGDDHLKLVGIAALSKYDSVRALDLFEDGDFQKDNYYTYTQAEVAVNLAQQDPARAKALVEA